MSETKATIIPNGPILIPAACASYQIGDGDELKQESKGGNIALCRCGLSQNKPFCDGSHNGAFEAEGCSVTISSDA